MTKINIEREEFIRVGTTLYKLVNQPRLNGGYVKKRIPWNAETLRQDYGKGFMASIPKYESVIFALRCSPVMILVTSFSFTEWMMPEAIFKS